MLLSCVWIYDYPPMMISLKEKPLLGRGEPRMFTAGGEGPLVQMRGEANVWEELTTEQPGAARTSVQTEQRAQRHRDTTPRRAGKHVHISWRLAPLRLGGTGTLVLVTIKREKGNTRGQADGNQNLQVCVGHAWVCNILPETHLDLLCSSKERQTTVTEGVGARCQAGTC